MQRINLPSRYPGHSCLDPTVRAGSHVDAWFDAQREHEGHLYFTDKDCRVLGNLVGLVNPRELRRVQAESDAKDERIRVLEAQLLEEQRRWDALDVLESEGFTTRRKAGRKPRETVA